MTPNTSTPASLPVCVDTTIPESAANEAFGARYGVDWIYHDDRLGYLPALPCRTLEAAIASPAGEGGLPIAMPSDTGPFTDWLSREMPPGTIIGNPGWWATRILRQIARLATPEQPGSAVQGEKAEVRRNDDGSLDEVHGRGEFHLEQMAPDHWWMQLGPHRIAFQAKRGISAYITENEYAVAPPPCDDGAAPLDLEQHEREALNYLGASLKDRNAKRAVDKALALCDFYAGRNQLTFCHRDLLQRKLLPAAAPAVAKMWLELVEQIAAPLNCRASEHVDANAHVIAAARRLAATQPEARGVEGITRYFPSKPPADHPGWEMTPHPEGEWVLLADVRALATPNPVRAEQPEAQGECETCGLRQPAQSVEYLAALNMLADFNPGADEFTEALEVLRCAAPAAPGVRVENLANAAGSWGDFFKAYHRAAESGLSVDWERAAEKAMQWQRRVSAALEPFAKAAALAPDGGEVE